jgi:hypothetical protein
MGSFGVYFTLPSIQTYINECGKRRTEGRLPDKGVFVLVDESLLYVWRLWVDALLCDKGCAVAESQDSLNHLPQNDRARD